MFIDKSQEECEMFFSKNLKRLRKENNLSQEGIAEILDVSRQAVSKYEQGNSYPEIEKLMVLSQRFNVSIDSLLSDEQDIEVKPLEEPKVLPTERNIFVSDYKGRTIVSYSKFKIAPIFKSKENQPKCTLLGIEKHTFWGEDTNILGYYALEADAIQEIKEIQQAIEKGKNIYELKYSTKVKETFWNITLDE